MGWTSYYVGAEKDRQKLMIKELENYGDVKVLKSAMRGRVFYGAYTSTNHPEQVRGIVCLTSLRDGDFAYKDMDESTGPYYYDCPKNILDLLTPTENKWALAWREKCRQKKTSIISELNKLPDGSVIEVDGVRYFKHAPAYQFKKSFWKQVDRFNYIPITRIKKYTLIQ